LLQRDRWVYQTAARASEELHSFDRTTRPVVVSPAHARELELMLECDAAGKPRQFSARLGPGRTVAYLTRSVTAERPGLVVTPGVESPLHGLARDAYAAPGVRVAGQTESLSPGEPPAVVLERVRR